MVFEAPVGNWSGRAYGNKQLLSPFQRINTTNNVNTVVQAPFARDLIIYKPAEKSLYLTH
jgi:hypothetical protein